VGRSDVGDDDGQSFDFRTLDGGSVSSAVARGKICVLVFVDIGNMLSQAQVRYVLQLAKHEPDVFYAVVALEPERNRELVEIYRSSLGIPFPVALPDRASLEAAGEVGDVAVVPTVMVLDARGRLKHRRTGLSTYEDLRHVIAALR
jgi:hypothetical protein